MKNKLFTIIGIFVGTALIIGILTLMKNSPASSEPDVQSVREENGTQIIHVRAGGGYTPRQISAAANKPTVLEMETRGTYDCSTSFTIPALGIRKQLPASGLTRIELSTQKAGTSLVGICSMGMYSFTVNFS